MTDRPTRLAVVGSVLVDIVVYVQRLPTSGGDARADDWLVTTGSGFNVMSAAARHGLDVAYAGRHGTGPFGDQVRKDCRGEAIEMLLDRTPGVDTGFCVGLVAPGAATAYVTCEGVDGSLTEAEVSSVEIREDDVVYLSGYDLCYDHARVITDWFCALRGPVMTVFDPGPLVDRLPADLLGRVLARADWVSVNQREAHVLTGFDDPALAVGFLSRSGAGRRGSIVRAGSDGCWLALRSARGTQPQVDHVPVTNHSVAPVDTSGAGDTHVGAFVAAWCRGLTALDACRWANAAAAQSVTVRGPATAPSLASTGRNVDGLPG